MNIVQCLSHSIEEHDMLKMYARMGVNVFSVGGYINPSQPHDPKRPAVSGIAYYPQLQEAVDSLRQPDNLRAAQENLPRELLDWADVIVFHHYLDRLYGQWPRISDWLRAGSHRRVIWRTVGQSVDGNEYQAQEFRNKGMQIVRYSPKERNIPHYAGEDALIRFGKDPDDWYGWHGRDAYVGNVTQHMKGRDPYTNFHFWEQATKGLNAFPAGPGSEEIGGIGEVNYETMREYLRTARVYLYTGTQPASYTLGLIEAMMTGTPVVSIPPRFMRLFPYGDMLFEGWDIIGPSGETPESDHSAFIQAHDHLEELLNSEHLARRRSQFMRDRAIDLFGIDKIAAQWAAFLGVEMPATVAA